MSSGSAATVGDAQVLAAEEAKVGAQCCKTDGTTAFVVGLTERYGDARRRFLQWNGIKM